MAVLDILMLLITNKSNLTLAYPKCHVNFVAVLNSDHTAFENELKVMFEAAKLGFKKLFLSLSRSFYKKSLNKKVF